jgi:hypothetical protein
MAGLSEADQAIIGRALAVGLAGSRPACSSAWTISLQLLKRSAGFFASARPMMAWSASDRPAIRGLAFRC